MVGDRVLLPRTALRPAQPRPVERSRQPGRTAHRRSGVPIPSTIRPAAGLRDQWPIRGSGPASAARRRTTSPHLGRPLAQDRESRERDLLDLLTRATGEGHHQKVLADREIGEYAASLGNQADPGSCHIAEGHPGGVAPPRNSRPDLTGCTPAATFRSSSCPRHSARAAPRPARRPAEIDSVEHGDPSYAARTSFSSRRGLMLLLPDMPPAPFRLGGSPRAGRRR